MRRGVRVAVDIGDVRVGVAACDPDGLVASPVETVPAGRGAVRRIADLVAERGAVEVVVGLPRSLSGHEGAAAGKARDFAARLAAAIAPVGVRLVDERLTTVTATRDLRASGVRGRKARTVVDQAAAVVILNSALETERSSGRPPGLAVEVPDVAATGTGTAGGATPHPEAPPAAQHHPDADPQAAPPGRPAKKPRRKKAPSDASAAETPREDAAHHPHAPSPAPAPTQAETTPDE